MKRTIAMYLQHPRKGARRTPAEMEPFDRAIDALLVEFKWAKQAPHLTRAAVISAVNAVRSAELQRDGGATKQLRALWQSRNSWLEGTSFRR